MVSWVAVVLSCGWFPLILFVLRAVVGFGIVRVLWVWLYVLGLVLGKLGWAAGFCFYGCLLYVVFACIVLLTWLLS